MTRLRFTVILLVITPALCAQQTAELPKVVLIGDSIRIGYAPVVAKKLAGRAEVISPEPNGGDSANVLKNLEVWVVKAKPALVHVNCGLHDLKKAKKDGSYQVPLDAYDKNLRELITRLRK